MKILTTDERAHLANLASDRSGYTREAALIRCKELAHPDLLPVVVRRLNDWVRQVRDAAQSAFVILLPIASVPQLLAALPSVQYLQCAGRDDHTESIERYEQHLIQCATVQELVDAAQGRNVHMARACFHLLKKYGLVERASLIRLFLENRNDIMLARTAVHLCAELPLEERRQLYLAAMRSHFCTVRTIAMRNLLNLEDGLSNQEVAVSFLFDAQSSVRSWAMTYLLKSGYDVGAYYRQALKNPQCSEQQIQKSLISLASVGCPEDIDFVRTHLTSTQPAIRLAAFYLWSKFDPDAKDDVAATALLDTSLRIRKFALYMTTKRGAYIPFELIRSTLKTKENARLLLFFAKRDEWLWRECIVRTAIEYAADDAELKTYLAQQLHNGPGRGGYSYEEPTAEQKAYLSSEPVKAILGDLFLLGKRRNQRIVKL